MEYALKVMAVEQGSTKESALESGTSQVCTHACVCVVNEISSLKCCLAREQTDRLWVSVSFV